MSKNFEKQKILKEEIKEERIYYLDKEYELKIVNEKDEEQKKILRQKLKVLKKIIQDKYELKITFLKEMDDLELKEQNLQSFDNEKFKIENSFKSQKPISNQKSEQITSFSEKKKNKLNINNFKEKENIKSNEKIPIQIQNEIPIEDEKVCENSLTKINNEIICSKDHMNEFSINDQFYPLGNFNSHCLDEKLSVLINHFEIIPNISEINFYDNFFQIKTNNLKNFENKFFEENNDSNFNKISFANLIKYLHEEYLNNITELNVKTMIDIEDLFKELFDIFDKNIIFRELIIYRYRRA